MLNLGAPFRTQTFGAAVLMIAVVVVGVAIAWVGLHVGTVDGWSVGPAAACQDRVVYTGGVETARGRCDELLPVATKALDLRDPGHPAVVSAQLHELSLIQTGGPLLYVAVFRLADGSLRGVGVGWAGVATMPITVPYGPRSP